MHGRLLCAAAAALTLIVACKPRGARPGSQSPVLLRVDGKDVTVADAQAELDHLPPRLRASYAASSEKQRELTKMLIDAELMAGKAKALGYDKDPEVIAATKRAMVRKFLEARDAVAKASEADISALTVEAFYRDNQQTFHAPERARITQVIVSDQARAAEVWRLAKALAEKHRQDPAADIAAFKQLVEQYSVDEASKSTDGDITVIIGPPDDPLRPIGIGAFALERAGDVSAPIEVEGRFHILKLREHVPAGPRPLDQAVSDRIKHMLSDKRRTAEREEMLSALRSAARVEVFDQQLSGLRFDSPPSRQVASKAPGTTTP
jgi:peptidyl-prolyl cis-trans isomerase C